MNSSISVNQWKKKRERVTLSFRILGVQTRPLGIKRVNRLTNTYGVWLDFVSNPSIGFPFVSWVVYVCVSHDLLVFLRRVLLGWVFFSLSVLRIWDRVHCIVLDWIKLG